MASGNENDKGAGKGIAGIMRGFAELLGKLEEVAETGQQLQKSGSFDVGPRGSEGKPGKGVFGFSVNVGLPGQQPKIEPFGNLRRDLRTGESHLEETREPLVDVFDEDERLLVIAELPGIDAEDIHVELADHSLTLTADHGERKYRKRLKVPAGLRREAITIACRNGIAEISCPKQESTRH